MNAAVGLTYLLRQYDFLFMESFHNLTAKNITIAWKLGDKSGWKHFEQCLKSRIFTDNESNMHAKSQLYEQLLNIFKYKKTQKSLSTLTLPLDLS